jgi:hypothetical protein
MKLQKYQTEKIVNDFNVFYNEYLEYAKNDLMANFEKYGDFAFLDNLNKKNFNIKKILGYILPTLEHSFSFDTEKAVERFREIDIKKINTRIQKSSFLFNTSKGKGTKKELQFIACYGKPDNVKGKETENELNLVSWNDKLARLDVRELTLDNKKFTFSTNAALQYAISLANFYGVDYSVPIDADKADCDNKEIEKNTDSVLEKFIERYKETICKSLIGNDKGEKVLNLFFDGTDTDILKMKIFKIIYNNSIIEDVKISLRIDYENLKKDIEELKA